MEGSLLSFPPAPLCKGQRRENGEEGAQLQGVPRQDPKPWAWSQTEPEGVREVGSGRESNDLGPCLSRVGPPLPSDVRAAGTVCCLSQPPGVLVLTGHPVAHHQLSFTLAP